MTHREKTMSGGGRDQSDTARCRGGRAKTRRQEGSLGRSLLEPPEGAGPADSWAQISGLPTTGG